MVDFDPDIYITGSNAYLLSSKLSTQLSYLTILENAYIIYKVPRYDIKGKELKEFLLEE